MYRIKIMKLKSYNSISFDINEGQFQKLIDLFEPQLKKNISSSVGGDCYPLEKFFNEEVSR